MIHFRMVLGPDLTCDQAGGDLRQTLNVRRRVHHRGRLQGYAPKAEAARVIEATGHTHNLVTAVAVVAATFQATVAAGSCSANTAAARHSSLGRSGSPFLHSFDSRLGAAGGDAVQSVHSFNCLVGAEGRELHVKPAVIKDGLVH